MPVLLIDSVYRTDENYYRKMFFENFIYNFFLRRIKTLVFGALEVPPET